jgi:hypothetical protein
MGYMSSKHKFYANEYISRRVHLTRLRPNPVGTLPTPPEGQPVPCQIGNSLIVVALIVQYRL